MHSVILLMVLTQTATTPVWDSDAFANTATWKSLETGSVTLDSREVKGSPYSEYRATTDASGAAEQLCAAVFDWATKAFKNPDLQISKVLSDSGDTRSVYQRTKKSIVSVRDMVVTSVRRTDDKGVCRIRAHATNELAPPLEGDIVRMDRLWTSWTFEPKGDGKTHVTLTMFNDPAGSVPPFIVHGAQRSSTKQTLTSAIESAQTMIATAK